MNKKRNNLERKITRNFMLATAFSLTILSGSVYFGIQHNKLSPYEQNIEMQYAKKQKESEEIFYIGSAVSLGIVLLSGVYLIRKCREIEN